MYLEFENFLFSNSTFFAIFFSAVIATIRAGAKTSIFKMWIIFLVGVFFHELMHFLAGVISFGFPYKLSIIPKKIKGKNGYMMGHVVNYNIKWYNVFIINMAPLALIPIAFYIYKYFFFYVDETVPNFIIWNFLIISLLFSSIPSSIDIKNIFIGNAALNIFAGLIEVGFLMVGLYIYFNYFSIA